jgi:hypothetical protein
MLHDQFHGGGGPVGGSEDPIAPPGTYYSITVDWAGKGTGAQLSPDMDVTFA